MPVRLAQRINLRAHTSQSLEERSNAYTVRRAQEFCDHQHTIANWNDARSNPPQYITQYRQCPCGSELPCPHHEKFPTYFWKLNPFSALYRDHLLDRNIPYRQPLELAPRLLQVPGWTLRPTHDPEGRRYCYLY